MQQWPLAGSFVPLPLGQPLFMRSMVHVRFSEAVNLSRSGAGFVSLNVEKALDTIRVPVCSLVRMRSAARRALAQTHAPTICITRSGGRRQRRVGADSADSARR